MTATEFFNRSEYAARIEVEYITKEDMILFAEAYHEHKMKELNNKAE